MLNIKYSTAKQIVFLFKQTGRTDRKNGIVDDIYKFTPEPKKDDNAVEEKIIESPE